MNYAGRKTKQILLDAGTGAGAGWGIGYAVGGTNPLPTWERKKRSKQTKEKKKKRDKKDRERKKSRTQETSSSSSTKRKGLPADRAAAIAGLGIGTMAGIFRKAK